MNPPRQSPTQYQSEIHFQYQTCVPKAKISLWPLRILGKRMPRKLLPLKYFKGKFFCKYNISRPYGHTRKFIARYVFICTTRAKWLKWRIV